MNRDFRILWFEDTKNWFKAESKKVKAIIESHFLIPKIEWHANDDGSRNCLSSNQYDLILVDFNLGCKQGNELIRQIRANQIITDVLFYSADIHSLYASLDGKDGHLDGVYISSRERDDFESKVDSLVEKIIHRSEDVVNLRGFVLDNTSEFESRVASILNRYWEKADESERNTLRDKVIERYRDKHESLVKWKTKAEESEPFSFSEHNGRHELFGIQDRLRLLNTCKQLIADIDFGASPNLVEYYKDRINEYRNGLGHLTCDGESIVVNEVELKIDENLFKALRKNVCEIDTVLSNIENNLEAL